MNLYIIFLVKVVVDDCIITTLSIENSGLDLIDKKKCRKKSSYTLYD